MSLEVSQLQTALKSEITKLEHGIKLLEKADSELIKETETAMGGASGVALWLTTPNPILEEAIPLELAQTEEGRERVIELLNQIKHGIYV